MTLSAGIARTAFILSAAVSFAAPAFAQETAAPLEEMVNAPEANIVEPGTEADATYEVSFTPDVMAEAIRQASGPAPVAAEEMTTTRHTLFDMSAFQSGSSQEVTATALMNPKAWGIFAAGEFNTLTSYAQVDMAHALPAAHQALGRLQLKEVSTDAFIALEAPWLLGLDDKLKGPRAE